MTDIISKKMDEIDEIERTLGGIQDQIAFASGVLQCLNDEGLSSGSPSAVRTAEEIDEEDGQVREWLRTLRAHRTALQRKKNKIEGQLNELLERMELARRKAQQEQDERKARVSG